MNWPYAYTPYLWPMLATTALLIVLGAYAWRRRYIEAAVPFVLLTLFWSVWALAAVLELAARDDQTKFFWFVVQAVAKLPTVSCALIFVLRYAGLDQWITRTTLAVLALPCILLPVILVTNPPYDLFWTSIHFGMTTQVTYGPLAWAVTADIYLLFLLQVGALVWFWRHAPLERWPVSLMILAALVARVAAAANVLGINPVAPLDPAILFSSLPAMAFFLALFRFRILDVIPVGREAAFEDMANGLLILNAENRIADMNPAAQKMLALPRASAIGCTAADALGAHPRLVELLAHSGAAETELTLDGHVPARFFQVQLSVLTNPHGLDVGRLMWLRDVTEPKHAREQLHAQQRMLAVVEERERLARELHDTLVQTTAAIRMEAEVADQLLTQGDLVRVHGNLAHLAEAAQEMHLDLREYLFGVSPSPAAGQNFFPALRAYLAQFERRWGIETRLQVPAEMEQAGLGAAPETQLMRIVQEALANVRKHARARRVEIVFECQSRQIQITVQDDGCGFEPALLAVPDARGFGTRAMRERAETIGGTAAIQSAPGQGTRVIVRVPAGA